MKKTLILSALFAASVVAARADLYVGASVATTAADFDTAVDNFESDEFGWKAYLGWNFLDRLGAEAGYRDLGNFSEGSTESRIDVDLYIIDVSARVFLPIGKRFQIFGKIGYANISWDGEITEGTETEGFDEDDWELFFGVGAEFAIGKNFALRAEWEIYDSTDNLSTLSAGAVFRF